jgi:hypothetical protein
MYLVVSVWEALPGKAEAFRESGMKVGSLLKKQPGVKLLEVFESGDKFVSVHGYADEATYQRLVQDPNGPFAKAVAESRVEDYARWLSSERGETVPIP